MRIEEISFTRTFDRLFRELPGEMKEAVYEKLSLLLKDPRHPSLRVKKMKTREGIWEMTITRNYRVTFELQKTTALLRKIGTHRILENP